MDKTREEAWKREVLDKSGSPIPPDAGERFAFDAGFDAGAASVDRVEVVREAFGKLKRRIANDAPEIYTVALFQAIDRELTTLEIKAMEKGK